MKTLKRYQYLVLQSGSLPLQPDGEKDYSQEHRCDSVLIWPEHQAPSPENAILTDPCFTWKGFEHAEALLKRIKITIEDLKYIFVTHRHGDHMPNFPYKKKFLDFQEEDGHILSDVDTISCPGHAPELRCLRFLSFSEQMVWIVGDAILNERWLKAWGYYWPNLYSQRDIIQSWRSVALILEQADVIIPGHGGQIVVTPDLLQLAIANFPSAEYADKCPEVKTILTRRLKKLEEKEQRRNEKTACQDQ